MMESAVDKDEAGAGIGALAGRIVLIALAALGVLAGGAFVTGFLVAYSQDAGGKLSLRDVLILGGATMFVLACAYGGWRAIRSLQAVNAAAGPATPRETRNRLVMVVAGLLGGAISLILVLQHDSPASNPLALLDGPLSPGVAIAVALLVGVLVPALSIYWHVRVIDEQEAAAYNRGALLAMYAFWIGAPVWWLLWRGGLVPAPDGMLIYLATALIATIVWVWGKYR